MIAHDPLDKRQLAEYVERNSFLAIDQVRNAIPPIDVIRHLNRHQIAFLLVGTHGLAPWRREPRGTHDVDVLIRKSQFRRAVPIFQRAFKDLCGENHEDNLGMRDPETGIVLIDVISASTPLFKAAFKDPLTLEIRKQSFRIPSLEMALAMKYAEIARQPWSEAHKYMDIADFMLMALANAEIDFTKLAELGDLVYPGGGKEIIEKVRQVRAGEKLVL